MRVLRNKLFLNSFAALRRSRLKPNSFSPHWIVYKTGYKLKMTHKCMPFSERGETCFPSITLSDTDLWLQRRSVTPSPTVPPWNSILLLWKVAPCVWSPVKVLRDQREHVCHRLERSADLLQSLIDHHERQLRSSERCSSLGCKDEDASDLWPHQNGCL